MMTNQYRSASGGRARVGPLVVMLLMSIVTTTSAVVLPTPVAAAATIHVAPWGDDSAAGTESAPFQTVQRAVRRARSGDEIVLRGGTYRESIEITGKAVAIASASGERAVFDGAQQLTSWEANDGDWYVDGWTQQFPQAVDGPVSADDELAGYPDQVFRNGRPLDQVLSRAEVEPGTFFHDVDADRIYIGDDPRGARIEASALAWALYFRDAAGSSLENVTVRRYATPARSIAAIRVHSNDMVVRNVISELNAAAGLSVIGERVVVQQSRFSDNGYLGVHAHESTSLVIEDSVVVGNNKAQFDPRHSAGGIKVTTSSRVTVRNNDVSRNGGPGIWTDLDARLVTIVHNRVVGNGRSGIEIELSSDVIVASNVSVDNGEAGVWVLESQNTQVFNNAMYRNVREVYVLEGDRAQVDNIAIRNNIIGDGRGGQALIVVKDWTRQRAAADMNVRVDFNAYWQPDSSPVKPTSEWNLLATRSSTSADLQQHQRQTGQDLNSVWSASPTSPYSRDAEIGDYRAPAAMALGIAVSGTLATELGVGDGERPPLGPVSLYRGRVLLMDRTLGGDRQSPRSTD